MDNIFFDGWRPLLRTGMLGRCAYAALILLLRISGKRTLSKMNAFDFLVIVALGSMLAGVILSKDTSLAQGVFAFMLLIAIQLEIHASFSVVSVSGVGKTSTLSGVRAPNVP